MSRTSTTIRTPNPAERSLKVLVSESSFATAGGVIPPEGTLYGDAAFKSFFGADYRKEFANFRYVTQSEDTKDGGTLIFVMNRTQRERDTPFRTTSKFGGHYWHPILKALIFLEDPLNPRSFTGTFGNRSATYSGPTYRVKEAYIPASTNGSRFVIEEFFADVVYVISQYPAPQPSSVSYQVPGAQGGFPECLHGGIVIPQTRTTTSVSVQGSATGIIGSLSGQSFPRTNFKRWAPYVLSDTQSFDNGYYRVRITVFPPPVPRVSLQ